VDTKQNLKEVINMKDKIEYTRKLIEVAIPLLMEAKELTDSEIMKKTIEKELNNVRGVFYFLNGFNN